MYWFQIKKTQEGDVQIGLNSSESVNITTKKYVVNKTKKNLEYGSFLKTSKLTPEGIVDHEHKEPITAEEVMKTTNMTDEELFAACGGRTAHKYVIVITYITRKAVLIQPTSVL